MTWATGWATVEWFCNDCSATRGSSPALVSIVRRIVAPTGMSTLTLTRAKALGLGSNVPLVTCTGVTVTNLWPTLRGHCLAEATSVSRPASPPRRPGWRHHHKKIAPQPGQQPAISQKLRNVLSDIIDNRPPITTILVNSGVLAI